MKEGHDIEPETFANLVSSTLYQKRFGPYFIGPLVAGINSKTSKPFICSFDLIGCIDYSKDFAVSGTASDQLFECASPFGSLILSLKNYLRLYLKH